LPSGRVRSNLSGEWTSFGVIGWKRIGPHQSFMRTANGRGLGRAGGVPFQNRIGADVILFRIGCASNSYLETREDLLGRLACLFVLARLPCRGMV